MTFSTSSMVSFALPTYLMPYGTRSAQELQASSLLNAFRILAVKYASMISSETPATPSYERAVLASQEWGHARARAAACPIFPRNAMQREKRRDA